MNISKSDKDLYEKIILSFPYNSVIYELRNHSLGEGFHELIIKPLHILIFEYENNPIFKFKNQRLNKALKNFYENCLSVTNYLSTNTMLGVEPYPNKYYLDRPWKDEYTKEKEDRFRNIIKQFDRKVSLDFVKAYDSLVVTYESISSGDENKIEFVTLHPKIMEACDSLLKSGNYAEAVEKSFKIVRDKLRDLTGHETGSEAFGKTKLHIKGASAKNVEEDFREGAKFLTMAIDRFRNEKAHTSNASITSPNIANEYLTLSSLALRLLDNAEIIK